MVKTVYQEKSNISNFIARHKKRCKNPIDEKEGISKCIVKISVHFYLSLAPVYQNVPLEGIKRQHLNPMVMKYNNDVGGVILGYKNLEILDESFAQEGNGVTDKLLKLTADTPFVFTWCAVDLIVWQPQIGDILEGWIFIQSASHIGLLIHDAFNASIRRSNIPDDWVFIHNGDTELSNGDSISNSKLHSLGHWVDGNGRQLDGKLKFTLKRVYTTGKMVSLEGTLIKDSNISGSRIHNLPVVSNKKIIFDDEVSQENKESHKDLELSVVKEANGDEIVYEKDSSESDSSDSN